MAVPKRRVSHSKTSSRKANWKLTAPALVACGSCGELIAPHRACPACGMYKGKEVVKVDGK
ncbi:50S ribosomal protein L32 [Treponema sp. R6D11]